MAEKMFSLTHLISETKLLGLIAAHADEVRVDIFQPERKAYQRRLQNGGGAASPLMLEGPKAGKHSAPGPAPQPMRKGEGGKKSVPHLTLEYLAIHKNRVVTSAELEAHAIKHHKKKHAVSVSLSGFLKKGYIERVGKGEYKILKEGTAKVGPLDAGPHPKKAKQTGVGRGNYDRSQSGKGTGLIWAELVKGEPVASQPMHQVYKDNQLAPKSISNAFASFVRRGLARRVSEGVFHITPKGVELHAKQTATNASTT